MISVCGLFFRSCVRVHVGGLVCVTTIGGIGSWNESWNEIVLQPRWSAAVNVDGKTWGEH